MYYRINVASRSPRTGNYVHLFATSDHSLSTRGSALEVFDLLARRFPMPDYSVTISRMELTGTDETETFRERTRTTPRDLTLDGVQGPMYCGS